MISASTFWRRATMALLLVAMATMAAVSPATAAGHAPAGRGARSTMLVDDYPYKTYQRGAVTDIWRFYNGFCTSFVAWRINDLQGKSDWANHHQLGTADESYWAFKNFMPIPPDLQVPNGPTFAQFGNGDNWDSAAKQLGWTVDSNPTVGSIAQWHAYEGEATGAASGHVAVVTKVGYSDGSVDVEEYNWSNAGAYDQRHTNGPAPRYIHVPGVPTTAKADIAVPPFATSSAYVQQTFKDVLNRPATSSETASWAGQINNGTDPGALVSSLFSATPFSTASSPTVRLYLAYFKRGPDLAGYVYWVGRLMAGNADPYWVSDAFAQSTEFQTTYGSLDNPSFVDLVYQNVLGRAADPNGRAYWISQLDQGVRRGVVMTHFSESTENVTATLSKVDVARLYLAMFQRTPDSGGWSFWTGQMAQGATTITGLADTFRSTTDYAKRVNSSTTTS